MPAGFNFTIKGETTHHTTATHNPFRNAMNVSKKLDEALKSAEDASDSLLHDVSLDEERLAAADAFQAYVMTSSDTEPGLFHFLHHTYLFLLGALRAEEVGKVSRLRFWLANKQVEKGRHLERFIMRQLLRAVSKLYELIFRRYSRTAFAFYRQELLCAKRLEIKEALLRIHDCLGLYSAIVKINHKFELLEDELASCYDVGRIHK